MAGLGRATLRGRRLGPSVKRGQRMAIEFIGFTTDHRVDGHIPLADDRLSDMLNSVARVVVRGASTTEIDSGHVEAGDVVVPCGEFLVVVGTGRRGVESQRRRTVTRRVQLGLGRYTVVGSLHVLPSASEASLDGKPEELLVGRDLLVPLTDATLSYDGPEGAVEQAWPTLLVNRARAAWIEALDEEPELADDVPEGSATRLARSRYLKDFTGTPSG
jgi:hypothetical protein